MDKVIIVEVGPRDGLQNEPELVPTAVKVELVARLVAAGLSIIEVGSFVAPHRVPQMKDIAELLRQLPQVENVRYPVLVPNMRGMEGAVASGVQEIAIFASASEGFSQANINCSIATSIERFLPVVELAKENNIAVRGYVSCVLGCPYEGEVPVGDVVRVSMLLRELGCYEISLGDTIGMGTPKKAAEMLKAVASEIDMAALAVHFHDTRGQAIANIYACLEQGVRVVDSAVAGLGGCPYAKGATGNVATEDLVFMLEGCGIDSGVDLAKLVEAGDYISTQLGRPTSSSVAKAMMAADG